MLGELDQGGAVWGGEGTGEGSLGEDGNLSAAHVAYVCKATHTLSNVIITHLPLQVHIT